MTEALLSVQGLRKAFGGLIAIEDVDLDLHPGEVVQQVRKRLLPAYDVLDEAR